MPQPAVQRTGSTTRRPGRHGRGPGHLLLWIIGLFCLLAGPVLLPVMQTRAQTAYRAAQEVRTLYPNEWQVSHPVGLAYSARRDQLALIDRFTDHATGAPSVVVITPYEDLVGNTDLPVGGNDADAVNIAFDDGAEALLLLEQGLTQLAQLPVDDKGLVDPTRMTRADIQFLALGRIQGMSVDEAGRHLFLLDAGARAIVVAEMDQSFALHTRIHPAQLADSALRGLAFHPIRRTLFVLEPARSLLHEVTQAGALLHSYDLTSLDLVDPGALAFAPSPDLTDAPDTMHLFIADSNLSPGVAPERFGRIVEVALDMAEDAAPQLVTAQVAAGEDDMEERVESGGTALTSSDLELTQDKDRLQEVGVRFAAVEIPAGATILHAHLAFAADEVDHEPTSLLIRGEAADTAAPFDDAKGDLGRRSRTAAAIPWSALSPWATIHAWHRTPDLSPVVQEIVDRPGWQRGNSLIFALSGVGKRTAESFDGAPDYAPRLEVVYTVPAATPDEPTPDGPTPDGPSETVIAVPGDAPTIQAGVDLAAHGDIVLVAPGIYAETIRIREKSVILASHYLTTGDAGFIEQTIIDGAGETVITVDESAGSGTVIVGFTIRNGDDGISPAASLEIRNNRFVGNRDAIDYEGGGGLCLDNLFEENSDDAIDLDGPVAVRIEGNTIRNNRDDGIEIRLQPYNGELLSIEIRGNLITGNGEDGIQLIDYGVVTDRTFLIEQNVIADNAMAGLGLMDETITVEDYRGASIPERIHLFNNTFVANDYAVSGGDNLIALNNLFVGSATVALKHVDAGSIAAHNLFWANGADQFNSNLDMATSLFVDPLLAGDYRLPPDSPAVDAGAPQFIWNDEAVLSLTEEEYNGAGPDLGALETEPPVQAAQAPSGAAVRLNQLLLPAIQR